MTTKGYSIPFNFLSPLKEAKLPFLTMINTRELGNKGSSFICARILG